MARLTDKFPKIHATLQSQTSLHNAKLESSTREFLDVSNLHSDIQTLVTDLKSGVEGLNTNSKKLKHCISRIGNDSDLIIGNSVHKELTEFFPSVVNSLQSNGVCEWMENGIRNDLDISENIGVSDELISELSRDVESLKSSFK